MTGFQPILRTQYIGRKLIHFPSIPSTNQYLINDYKGPFQEGLVVVADHQTAGKGRLNRQWQSGPSLSLLFSILVTPKMNVNLLPQLTQLCSFAITKVLEDYCLLSPRIKWPNDIFLNEKKCCGILCEAVFDQSPSSKVKTDLDGPQIVLGVGLNVNQREFPDEIKDIATSLYLETREEWDREALFSAILRSFEDYYELWKNDKFPQLIEEIGLRFFLKGKEVDIISGKTSMRAVVVGLNSQGFLLVRDKDGHIVPILSGDIQLCS
ncbi:MAG: bifunctional ligase/repressor BirA [bacterium]|nr:MAG: bifunctional ligase/repressor BirA [bacterium]